MKIKNFIIALILIPFFIFAEGKPGGGSDSGGGNDNNSNQPEIKISTEKRFFKEGDSGQKSVYFTISIDKCPNRHDLTFKYYTIDLNAKVDDHDYNQTSGTITFTENNCTKSEKYSAIIYGDTKVEQNENFRVKIKQIGDAPEQEFTITNDKVDFVIINDDKSADLAMDKYILNDEGDGIHYANKGGVFWYYLDVRNNGPYKTEFKVVDNVPKGLKILEIHSDYKCSKSSQKVTCNVPSSFPKNQDKNIARIKVEVTTKDSKYIDNIARVQSTDLPDTDKSNNSSDAWIAINPPGGVDGVDATKDVNVSTAKIGEKIRFTIKAVNRGFSRYIKIEDYFNQNGTTKNAFIFDTSSIHILNKKDGDNLTCKSNKELFWCKTSKRYKNKDFITVTIDAIVNKRGKKQCNMAHILQFDDEDEWEISKDSVCIKTTGNHPPKFKEIQNKRKKLGSNFKLKLKEYVLDKDLPNETFTFDASNLPPGLHINKSTGKISGNIKRESNITYPKDYIVKVIVTDSHKAQAKQTFTITVYTEKIKATNNKYKTKENQALRGDFVHDDTGRGKDRGVNIKLLSHTNPDRGTLEVYKALGHFKYIPESNKSYITSFNYTITDDNNNTDTATVTIIVGDVSEKGFKLGFQEFKRINPEYTRNIVGNFLTTGNSIECVTNKKNPKNAKELNSAKCINAGQDKYYNNNYAVKYIDIDNNPNTWNSSSANFVLPETLNKSNDTKKTILWAALFWQGGVNNTYSFYDSNKKLHKNEFQRRAINKDGDGYQYIVINKNNNKNKPLNVDNTDINKVLFKIDNSNYIEVKVNPLDNNSSLYYDNSQHGKKGLYYAAYADVTKILQDANLTKGKHTATVANITANEGREQLVGNYAGWSLVVIYKEDILRGKPRNISIYNGFVAMNGDGKSPSKGLPVELPIKGFKLPKTGEVNAKLSVFAGEGEYIYGNKSTTYDKIYLKENNNSNTPEDNVPATDGGDPTNIFDAKLTNIDRDKLGDNDVENTNAIDIDDYNVSSIVQKYRDRNKKINSLYIGLTSNDDYVTTSMLGFSVELYKPNMCYDYTLSLGNYVIPSLNNKIKTSYGMLGEGRLTTRVSIQSQEADFVLKDVRMVYDINDTNMLTYRSGSTKIAPPGTNEYIDASSQTYNETPSGFTLNIGNGATSNSGGIIDANEKRYFKFDDDTKVAYLNAKFSLKAEYKVNYGSGDVEFAKNFTVNDICNLKSGYTPEYGIFNITSENVNSSGEPYNLYTQVANRPFNVKIFSYKDDLKSPKKFDGVVDFEPYNADYFPHDTELSCKNPDSNLNNGKFVYFDNNSSVNVRGIKYNTAARNVGFRVWYLKDLNGTIIKHHCNANKDSNYDNLTNVSQANEKCFSNIYKEYYKSDNRCSANCNQETNGCYRCLKKYYGVPICSRDNFSIRPESFVTVLKDDKEGNSTNPRTIAISKGSNNSANIVAGYVYNFDINATSHTNDNAVSGYVQTFTSNSTNNVASLSWYPENGRDVSECNDTSDKNISLVFFNGRSYRFKGVPKYKLEQVGRYSFTLLDKDWTAVDWSDNNATAQNTLHHNKPGFSTEPDCLSGKDVPETGKVGCQTSSILGTHKELVLRYYPYKFNLDNMKFYAGPTEGNKTKVFINTLDSTQNYPFGYKDIGNENMAYNIVGDFSAVSYTGKQLSNFTKGCYADPVDVIVNANYTHNTPTNTPNITYDLNETDKNNLTTKYENNISNIASNRKILFAHTGNDFAQNMRGKINIKLGINFKRDFNFPLNPRVIYFKDFNVTYHTQPSGLTIKQQNNHKIFSDKSIDKNISFIYGRVMPKKSLYDDVIQDSIKTPTFVELYCSLPLSQCSQRGVKADITTMTDNYNWFKAIDGFASNSNVFLSIDTSKATLSSNQLNLDKNGTDNNITVTKTDDLTLPSTVDIKFDTNNNTDRWLIYNSFSNTIPPYLFKVRFVKDGDAWSGVGKTGHTINNKEGQGKKTRRLDW